MIVKKGILLLKTQSEDTSDKYQTLLQASNFTVNLIKTLDFQFQNLQLLNQLLNNPDNYSGLIFSSPRCVEAVHKALNSCPLHENWHKKDNFAVGETTHNDVHKKLGLNCRGKESGNAVNLAQLIVANAPLYDRPFLFPCGNLKTDVLKTELGKVGLNIVDCVVYETIANPLIDEEIIKVTENLQKLPEFIVLFSPSGLNAAIKTLKKAPDINEVKFIAIGPVTAEAIEQNCLKLYSTAKNPKPQDVLDAILRN